MYKILDIPLSDLSIKVMEPTKQKVSQLNTGLEQHPGFMLASCSIQVGQTRITQ